MRFTLDRIEGNIAVLEDESCVMHDVDLSLLPCDAKQGDIIVYDESTLMYSIDSVATHSRTEYINSLFEKLKNRKDTSTNED